MNVDWTKLFTLTPVLETLLLCLDQHTLLLLCHVCSLWRECLLYRQPSLACYLRVTANYLPFPPEKTFSHPPSQLCMGLEGNVLPATSLKIGVKRLSHQITRAYHQTSPIEAHVAIGNVHIYFILTHRSLFTISRQHTHPALQLIDHVTLYSYHPGTELRLCYSLSLCPRSRGPHTTNNCVLYKEHLLIGKSSLNLEGDPCFLRQNLFQPRYAVPNYNPRSCPEYRSYPGGHLFALFRSGSAIEYLKFDPQKTLKAVAFCKLSAIISHVNSHSFPAIDPDFDWHLNVHNPFHERCVASTDPEGLYMWCWLPEKNTFLRLVTSRRTIALIPCDKNTVTGEVKSIVGIAENNFYHSHPNAHTPFSPSHDSDDESSWSDDSSCTSDCEMYCIMSPGSPSDADPHSLAGNMSCNKKNNNPLAYVSPLPVNNRICIILTLKPRKELVPTAIIVDATTLERTNHVTLPCSSVLGYIRTIRFSTSSTHIYLTSRHFSTNAIGQLFILNWSTDKYTLEHCYDVITGSWLRYRYPIFLQNQSNPDFALIITPAACPRIAQETPLARNCKGKLADLCCIKTLVNCGGKWISEPIQNARFNAAQYCTPAVSNKGIFLIATHDYSPRPHILHFSPTC